MKRIVIIILVSLFLGGCGNKSESTKFDLKQIIAEDNYTIVDVRTESEFLESHIVDAQNIPYDTIDTNVNLDKNKVVLVYCKSGNRSKVAYDTLVKLGYTVYDLGAFSSIDLPKE